MSAVDFTAVCLGALIMTVSAALTGFALASFRTTTATTAHGGVWCEATVVDAATSREWLLGGYRAPDPVRALHWTRVQAQRLADRIDPSPYARWAAPGAVYPCGTGTSDAAVVLRRWRDDTTAHRTALRALADGGLHVLTAPDDDGLHYRISARPPAGRGPRVMAGKAAYQRYGTERYEGEDDPPYGVGRYFASSTPSPPGPDLRQARRSSAPDAFRDEKGES